MLYNNLRIPHLKSSNPTHDGYYYEWLNLYKIKVTDLTFYRSETDLFCLKFQISKRHRNESIFPTAC